MTETMEKKKIMVNFDGDLSAKNVIRTTVRALKQAKMDKKANEFQVAVVSGKTMMDVVRSYVTII